MAASLYRRHRPRTFADVVGQEHVVRTLSNAIEQGRVHHAYLFVGSRGTGKTSMAKILAASLNCQGEAGGGTGPGGPTVAPCGACESCRAIAAATSLDVVEMDAASNNSVDDIRDLRERVAYAPVAGAYKVYILDEAHMLTPAAWNAFLKTLEEPPPHTIFVLATTEANKVLPTVVDRCHRFDFGRPSVSQLARVLRRAADAESIEIPDEAVALVARSATGSFRDALGTLEQLVAYSGKSIVIDDVLAVLGAADADLLFGAVDAVSAGDARAALLAAARLADSGRDLGRFFGDLEAHARALMVVQVLGEVPAELSVTPEQDERLAEQARRVGTAEVTRLLSLIADALRAMKDGADARTQLELVLVKAAKPELEPSVKALQERIARLEQQRAVTAPPSRAPHQPATPAARAAASSAPAPGGASASGEAAAPDGAAASAPSGAAAPTPASPAGGAAAASGAAAAGEVPTSSGGPSAFASSSSVGETAARAEPIAQAPANAADGESALAWSGPALPAERPPIADPLAPAPADRSPAATPAAPPVSSAPSPAADPAPPETSAPSPAADPAPPETSAPSPAADPAPPVSSAPSPAADSAPPVSSAPSPAADPAPVAAPPVAIADPAPADSPAGVSLETLGAAWPAVVESLREEKPMLAALLEGCAPAALETSGLTLAWPESSAFLKRKAEDPANRDLIAGAIRSVVGASVPLTFELHAEDAPPAATAAVAAPSISEEDLVQRFMDEFDAKEIPPDDTQEPT